MDWAGKEIDRRQKVTILRYVPFDTDTHADGDAYDQAE